jgi:hypothetical protein
MVFWGTDYLPDRLVYDSNSGWADWKTMFVIPAVTSSLPVSMMCQAVEQRGGHPYPLLTFICSK